MRPGLLQKKRLKERFRMRAEKLEYVPQKREVKGACFLPGRADGAALAGRKRELWSTGKIEIRNIQDLRLLSQVI